MAKNSELKTGINPSGCQRLTVERFAWKYVVLITETFDQHALDV